jgi:hypothetical protein
MNSVTTLDNLSDIDWVNIINNLVNGKTITAEPDIFDLNNPHYMKIYNTWRSANFNMDSVRWTNYYEYGDLTTVISKRLNVTPLRSWISRLDPGYIAPWHYDVDEREDEYIVKNAQRYSCFISESSIGDITIIGDDLFSNIEPGVLIKWNNRLEYHTGICASMKPSYMYHLIAY